MVRTIAPADGRYLGEIGIFAFGYAPEGWTECDGRLLPIAGHQPLFSVFGWRYGGDRHGTFALPDLGPAGSGGGRPELGPGLLLAFCIALAGTYPLRHPPDEAAVVDGTAAEDDAAAHNNPAEE